MSGEVKRLYRSREDRWLAGICGGLGNYFSIDPTVIRMLFVLFSLIIGGGFIAYLILWIVIPLEPEEAEDVLSEEEEAAV